MNVALPIGEPKRIHEGQMFTNVVNFGGIFRWSWETETTTD